MASALIAVNRIQGEPGAGRETVSTDGTLLRRMAYEQDGESDQLISRATWSLKLSGLVFAGLLVLGRSASSGNVVWNPTFHGASSPLVVGPKAHAPQNPVPPIPQTPPNIDNAALSKQIGRASCR